MTITSLATIASTNNSVPYVSGSFTPASNCMLLLFFEVESAVVTGTITVTGGSLTWTKQVEVNPASGRTQCLYTAPVSTSPGSMTVTIDDTSGDSSGCNATIIEVTGVNTTLVQTANVSANTTITLGGAMNTNNIGVLAAFNTSNPAGITEPSGWTELVDTGHNSPTSGMEVSYKNTGSTSSSLTVSSSATMIFVELSPSAVTQQINPFLMFVDW